MPTDDYLRFNTQSITELIQQRLENEGIDISRGTSAQIITDVVASVFELLQFQINRNVANSSFSKTQNLDAIISQAKILGYNPIGYQASQLFAEITLTNVLEAITYIIPRYAFFETSAGRFSICEDLTFANSFIPDDIVFEEQLFKLGSFVQHPLLTSTGNNNQRFTLSLGTNTADHNSFDVYVREPNGSWVQWEQVENLFLSTGSDNHFELRYTGNSYELVLGDCINGYAPPEGTEIAIYYLNTQTPSQALTANSESGELVRFSTTQLNQILSDISLGNKGVYINTLKDFFSVTNTSANTARIQPETVEDIRRNAPNAFQTQNRLVTAQDYETFISNNFSDFVSDVLVLDNQEYLDTYISYFCNLGLNDPLEDSRALFNQLNFADSVNYNNVWIFLVPRNGNFVSQVQKQLIVDRTSQTKTLTAEICPADPIYIEYALATPLTTIDSSDIETSFIRVARSSTTNRSISDIQQEVYTTIIDYFNSRSRTFNNLIDVNQLNTNVLNIDGVQEIFTFNETVELNNLQFYSYNPQFPDDVTNAPPTSQFDRIFVPRVLDNNLLGRIIVE